MAATKQECRNALIQGAAIAAALVAKQDMGDDMVIGILDSFVKGWAELKSAGVPDYDMKILKKYLRNSGWGKQ